MNKTWIATGLLLTLLLPTGINAQRKRKEQDMTIRQIVEKYYQPRGFFVGASGRTQYLKAKESYLLDKWIKEFNYNTPENDFKQSKVYQYPGAPWKSEEYMRWIEIARKNNQIIRAHGPVSPQSSKWACEDNRTAAELEEVMTEYMTRQSKDLQANKDVVKWMDVVNESFTGSVQRGLGYKREMSEDKIKYEAHDWFGPRKGVNSWENPWPYIGMDTVTVEGEPFVVPAFILKSFRIANQYAPDIKMVYNDHGKTINPALYERLKKTIKYLRSEGARVDAIGWQAHVDLGWEKDPENIKNLEDAIDWCYQNGLEFHVTELDVTVSKKTSEMNTTTLNQTRQEQAATICALAEVLLKKIGKGAVGLNFWTMSDHFNGGNTFAVLFDPEGNPNPAYFQFKELLLKYAQ